MLTVMSAWAHANPADGPTKCRSTQVRLKTTMKTEDRDKVSDERASVDNGVGGGIVFVAKTRERREQKIGF